MKISVRMLVVVKHIENETCFWTSMSIAIYHKSVKLGGSTVHFTTSDGAFHHQWWFQNTLCK